MNLADCANDLLCSKVISFVSPGGFERDQNTCVIVLQTTGAFPSNWVKPTVQILSSLYVIEKDP